jgi:hypothetical protein
MSRPNFRRPKSYLLRNYNAPQYPYSPLNRRYPQQTRRDSEDSRDVAPTSTVKNNYSAIVSSSFSVINGGISDADNIDDNKSIEQPADPEQDDLNWILQTAINEQRLGFGEFDDETALIDNSNS